MPSQSSSKKGPLDAAECAALRGKLKAQGLDFVREVTGLDATTILRAAAGLSVHNSTALLLRMTTKDASDAKEEPTCTCTISRDCPRHGCWG